MEIPSRVNQTERKPLKTNRCGFLCIRIWDHIDNRNNNSDRFIFAINGRIKLITDPYKYYFSYDKQNEENEYVFEVAGKREIAELYDRDGSEDIEVKI